MRSSTFVPLVLCVLGVTQPSTAGEVPGREPGFRQGPETCTNKPECSGDCLFDNGVWAVWKGDDTNPGNDRAPMDLYVDGVFRDSARLVKIYHRTQPDECYAGSPASWPEFWNLASSGAIRTKPGKDPYPYGGEIVPFGTSTVLGPEFWETAGSSAECPGTGDCDFHWPQVSEVRIDTTLCASKIVFSVVAEDLLGAFHRDHSIEVFHPSTYVSKTRITTTYRALRRVEISPQKQVEHQGFKLARFSSMWVNEGATCFDEQSNEYFDCHDSNAARYHADAEGSVLSRIRDLTFDSFIFHSEDPTRAGRMREPYLDSLHLEDEGWQDGLPNQSGNTPNLRLLLAHPALAGQCTPQGWLAASTSPNNDNLGIWINHDDSPAVWNTDHEAMVQYWLLAMDNPPLDLSMTRLSTTSVRLDWDDLGLQYRVFRAESPVQIVFDYEPFAPCEWHGLDVVQTPSYTDSAAVGDILFYRVEAREAN